MGSNRGLVAIRQRRLHFADYRARLQQRQVHAASNVGFSRIVSSYSWPRVILAFFPTSHSAVAKSVDVVGIERAARPTGTNSRIPMHAAVASGAAHSQPCIGFGSSAFGACLRPGIGPLLPALVAFAAALRDDAGQIISAVVVGNLGTCSDVLDGTYDDLMAYRVGLGIGPA